MAQTQPGTYILYKEPGASCPPWPGIVYIDEHAPPHIQQRRPSGYVTLILLMGEPYQFRWATTRQLSPLPNRRADLSAHSRELRQALETVYVLQEAGAGPDYWRDEVRREFGSGTLPDLGSDPDAEDELVGDEEEIDEQLKEALRISREAYYGPTPARLPTPSSFPPDKRQRMTHREVITLEDDDDDYEDFSLYSQPSPMVKSYSSPKRSRPSRLHEDYRRSSSMLSDDEQHVQKQQRSTFSASAEDTSQQALQETRRPSQILGQSTLDRLRCLGQSLSTPTSDNVDGDLTASKEFVQTIVGPDHESRLIPKQDVFNRHYFRDARSGVNFFALNDQNIWVLNHPQLVNINPDDFDFIIEYLTSGDFGHRIPDGEQEVEEALAQCMSAWKTAETLGMDDLLDFITEKMEARIAPWNLWEAMVFACNIYDSSDAILPAHDKMKSLLAAHIAEHYWIYVTDDYLSAGFLERLRQLPELDRDVQARRFPDTRPDAGIAQDRGEE